MTRLPVPLRDAPILALREAAQDAGLVQRLAWWAQHAFSSERWLQFELAFRMEQILGEDFSVGCERSYRDIVVYERDEPGSGVEGAPWTGSIELKWYPNWWTKDGGSAFHGDIDKIDGYEEPSLALCVWLSFWPQGTGPWDWVRHQVEEGTGVTTDEALRRVLLDESRSPPAIDEQFPCSPPEGVERMSLGAIGYFNPAGRQLLS